MFLKKRVLITNGSGGCGKDTMAEIMGKYVNTHKISSIDIIKKIVEPYTNEFTTLYGKHEKYRQLLSEVKRAFVNFNDLPTKVMEQETLNFLEDKETQVLIVDIREPEEIEKFKRIFPLGCVICKTILIINNNVATIHSNVSDDNVANYAYDYILDNSQTLEVLEDGVITLLQDLGFEVKEDD
jgi:dephospho-CoA kinase